MQLQLHAYVLYAFDNKDYVHKQGHAPLRSKDTGLLQIHFDFEPFEYVGWICHLVLSKQTQKEKYYIQFEKVFIALRRDT
jgi:hypothetical protein